MIENKDYLEIAFRSITCFSGDGKLDANELDKLLSIAEKDNHIDDNEKRVLNNILTRIAPSDIDDALYKKMQEVKRKVG